MTKTNDQTRFSRDQSSLTSNFLHELTVHKQQKNSFVIVKIELSHQLPSDFVVCSHLYVHTIGHVAGYSLTLDSPILTPECKICDLNIAPPHQSSRYYFWYFIKSSEKALVLFSFALAEEKKPIYGRGQFFDEDFDPENPSGTSLKFFLPRNECCLKTSLIHYFTHLFCCTRRLYFSFGRKLTLICLFISSDGVVLFSRARVVMEPIKKIMFASIYADIVTVSEFPVETGSEIYASRYGTENIFRVRQISARRRIFVTKSIQL